MLCWIPSICFLLLSQLLDPENNGHLLGMAGGGRSENLLLSLYNANPQVPYKFGKAFKREINIIDMSNFFFEK